jgi:predicted PurR-regulated permease PerM
MNIRRAANTVKVSLAAEADRYEVGGMRSLTARPSPEGQSVSSTAS